jgi:hypothetical protein
MVITVFIYSTRKCPTQKFIETRSYIQVQNYICKSCTNIYTLLHGRSQNLDWSPNFSTVGPTYTSRSDLFVWIKIRWLSHGTLIPRFLVSLHAAFIMRHEWSDPNILESNAIICSHPLHALDYENSRMRAVSCYTCYKNSTKYQILMKVVNELTAEVTQSGLFIISWCILQVKRSRLSNKHDGDSTFAPEHWRYTHTPTGHTRHHPVYGQWTLNSDRVCIEIVHQCLPVCLFVCLSATHAALNDSSSPRSLVPPPLSLPDFCVDTQVQ